MIRIVCSACQKPLSLDETKLPMKEVTFPCPACKAKLTIDRRQLAPAAAEPSAPAEPGAVPPVPAGTEAAPNVPAAFPEEDSYGEHAIIVGLDQPALRLAATSVGLQPVAFATAEQAREYYLQEYPRLALISPQQMTPPPLEAMQPLIGIAPADRRRCFFILVSDNLRTLDGNAAFLYGVNLVVSTRDLHSFARIYRDAMAYHDRLYASMRSLQKARDAA